jgi:DNA-directed RNA polymerase subunit K/omega
MPPKKSKNSTLSKISTKKTKPAKSLGKSKQEKLEDITDDVDSLNNDQLDELADDMEDLPELEMVSSALKEKYEYNPRQETKTIYVLPEARFMSEILTKFELCELISIRAKQLEDGGQSFTDIGDLSDPIEMARKEILDKKCPLSIVRARTTDSDTTIAELWHANEMGIPYD